VAIPFVISRLTSFRDEVPLTELMYLLFGIFTAIAVIRVFVTANLRVTTTVDSVAVRLGIRRPAIFLRCDTDFSSFATRRYNDGLPDGIIRKLVMTTAGGRNGARTTVVCKWFSPNTFNSLMSDVSPLVSVGTAGTEHPASGSTPIPIRSARTATTFTVKRTPIRRARKALELVALLFAITLGGHSLGLGSDVDPLVLLGILALILLIILLVGIDWAAFHRLPQNLTVTQSEIRIDGHTFAVSSIRSIVAVPAESVTFPHLATIPFS